MAVRKREWTTSAGESRSAWVVDYKDQQGRRCLETFATKREADARHAVVTVRISEGTHTSPTKSPTVEEAVESWIAKVELKGRETTTIDQYKQHKAHIVARIGKTRVGKLTAPDVHNFADDLLRHLSEPLARKVLTSLKSVLRQAQNRGAVAQNVAASVKIETNTRDKRKLEVGKDIPTPQEVRAIIAATEGRMKAFLLVAAFAGLRASELRGLRWQDVDLKAGMINVQQRIDRYGVAGPPKTASGYRKIEVGPQTVKLLREWKVQCPPGALVFPTKSGAPENYRSQCRRWHRVQSAAGVVSPTNVQEAKYPGLHSLRHYCASWHINKESAGGRGFSLQQVQKLMGHSSITMTMDVYSHLFESDDGGKAIADAERAALG